MSPVIAPSNPCQISEFQSLSMNRIHATGSQSTALDEWEGTKK
jgi:hypothetical protein